MHWLVLEQNPSPSLMPQTFPFGSHVPEAQTRAPLPAVHWPLMGATPGIGCPFGVLATQVPCEHHWPLQHVVSVWHDPPHAVQTPLLHSVPGEHCGDELHVTQPP
jgi:hypothetical protein